MGRASSKQNEAWQRVAEKGLAAQMTHSQIVRALMDYDPPCSKRSAYRIINRVYDRMRKDAEIERPMQREKMIGSLRFIMQRAIKMDKLSDAIQAADRIARVLGLYDDALRVHITGGIAIGDVPDLSRLSDEDLAELERLHTKALTEPPKREKALPAYIDVESEEE